MMKIYYTNDIHANYSFLKKVRYYLNQHMTKDDIYLDGERVGQSRNDRGETSEGLWYAAMDSEMNDGTFTDLARKYYGHEPTEDEMMAFATSIVSSFDLRGYPDMLDVGECAVLPDGIPLKVVRVENMKSRIVE